MVPATFTSQPRNLKSTPSVFPCTLNFTLHLSLSFKKKEKKKRKKEKRSNNKKLNKEAGTLRINHVSYNIDTDLITKRDKE